MKRQLKLADTKLPAKEDLIFHELGRLIQYNMDLSSSLDRVKLNPNQQKLFDILESSQVPPKQWIHLMCYGGVGGGKTYGILLYILKHAMLRYPGVRVLIVRSTLKDLKNSIYLDLQDILNRYGISYKKNDTNLKIVLENNSEVWMCSDKALTPASSDKADSLGGTQFSLVCLDKNTLVRTEEGETRISDIRPGMTVYGWDGSHFGTYPVTKVLNNGLRPTFEVALSNGRKLVATGNHPILTQRGWIHVDQLRLGDRCCAFQCGEADARSLPSVRQAQDGEQTAGAQTVSGVLQVGDGCAPAPLRLWNVNRRQRERVPGLLQPSPTGESAALFRLRDLGQEYCDAMPSLLPENNEWRGISAQAGRWVRQETSRESNDASVGLGTGGCSVASGTRGDGPEAGSSWTVCSGLLSGGPQSSDRGCSELRGGRGGSGPPITQILLLSREGDSHGSSLGNSRSEVAVGGDFTGGVTVVDIQPSGIREVWDLTVADVHNFVAEGVVVHNCLEEADSISEELAKTIPGRMRQNIGDIRKVIFYDCNPPSRQHWTYRWWFDDLENEKGPDDLESRFRACFMPSEGNVEHVGEDYMQAMSEDYARDPTFYRRMRLGQFGPNTKGSPIYAREFSEDRHVAKEKLNWNRALPLVRGWDFGYEGTGLVVLQDDIRVRRIKIFRSIVKQQCILNIFLDEILPELRDQFPGATWIDYIDPAGVQQPTNGESCIQIMRNHGLRPMYRRTTSIAYGVNVVMKQLRTTLNKEPVVILDPSCEILIEALGGGYVNKTGVADREINPRKDGFYDHICDALRYAFVNIREYKDDLSPHADPVRSDWKTVGGGDKVGPYIISPGERLANRQQRNVPMSRSRIR